MKNFNLALLALVVTLGMSSCSSTETLENENQENENQKIAKLVNSYTVSRDASGSYTLNYNLGNNVAADHVKNADTKVNEVFLYPSEGAVQKRVSENLVLDGEKVKVGFVNTNAAISIEDDGAIGKMFLNEYSITKNNDGTFQLDFAVKRNVEVAFVRNQQNNSYEIHLEKGKSNTKNFSRTFTKENGIALQVDFVNHIAATTSREAAQPHKPRMIIIEE